jgi:hypothetical protein
VNVVARNQARSKDSGGVDSGGRLRLRVEFTDGTRCGGAGVAGADDGACGGVLKIQGDQQASGCGIGGELRCAALSDEGNILHGRVFQRRNPAEWQSRVALKWGIEKGCEFLDQHSSQGTAFKAEKK